MPTLDLDAGKALWSAVTAPDRPPPRTTCGAHEGRDALARAARRFARYAGYPAAAWLLAPLESVHGPVLDPAEVSRHRPLNRLMRVQARSWLARVAESGIEVLALKGLATGARFYPEPLLRTMSDVDLLVRPADVQHLCDVLEAEGFQFRKSRGTPVWGMSSESSFHPLVAPDGYFIFDLHVAPDDYPVPRALGTDEVFARARTVELEDLAVGVPCDDHLLLLAITNAGRDKFGQDSLRSLLDPVVALAHAGFAPDWDAILGHARAGGFLRPVRAACRLMARLGVDASRLPSGMLGAYRGPAAWAFEAVARDYLTLFADRPSRTAMQMRDWTLISGPGTLLHRNMRRVRGLFAPWEGVPEGRRLA